jgi:hypothetical protein
VSGHLNEKASVFEEKGSYFQETYSGSLAVNLEANRSIVGWKVNREISDVKEEEFIP